MLVLVVFDDAVNGQVHTENEEKCRAYMPKPFLETLHLLRQFADAYCAVANQPSDEHDWQTRTQTEHDRHNPVPRARQRQRDINHRQEINQSVGTEGDGEEDTEDEGPEPTLLAVRLFEPFADAVVMLVVMVPAEEQHDAADQHKAREYRFAVMT